jgi:hypothetical protein
MSTIHVDPSPCDGKKHAVAGRGREVMREGRMKGRKESGREGRGDGGREGGRKERGVTEKRGRDGDLVIRSRFSP